MSSEVKRNIYLTSPNMSGEDVKAAQLAARARILARPNATSYLEAADGTYGPRSRAMIRQVIYMLGGDVSYFDKHGLTKTYQKIIRLQKNRPAAWIVRVKSRSNALNGGQAKRAVRFMADNIGVHDRNRNPVLGWCKEAGYAGGVSWCGVAVIKAMRASGLKIENSWGFGYVPNVYYAARRGSYGFKSVSPSIARAGDLVLFKWPGVSGDVADHIGMVETTLQALIDKTLEGNTSGSSSGSQYNGDSLQRKDRKGFGIVLVVRPPYAS